MKQECVGSNRTETRGFGDEAELETALAGILHQLCLVSQLDQYVSDHLTHTPDVFVRIAAFSAIAG